MKKDATPFTKHQNFYVFQANRKRTPERNTTAMLILDNRFNK